MRQAVPLEPSLRVSPTGSSSADATAVGRAHSGAVAVARLWAPWALLTAATLVAVLLLGVSVTRCMTLFERQHVAGAHLAGLVATAQHAQSPGSRMMARPPGALTARGQDGMTHRHRAQAEHTDADALRRLEGRVASLTPDSSSLLALAESVAQVSRVALLQFRPEAAPPSQGMSPAPGALALSVQAQGRPNELARFLHGITESGPALEWLALSLEAGNDPARPLCSLKLRVHDRASLQAQSAARGSVTESAGRPVAPGRAPVGHTRSVRDATGRRAVSATGSGVRIDADDSAWERIPDHAFAALSDVPIVLKPAEKTATGSVVSASRRTAPDALSGMRLVGIIGSGDRVSALLELPGIGAVSLRHGETLPGTRLQLASIGHGAVVFTGVAGAQRSLRLDGLETEALR